MTEYEAFVKCVPMIAEMVVSAKRMTERQYWEWRQEQESMLKTAGQKTNGFAWKVLEVVDIYSGKEVAA